MLLSGCGGGGTELGYEDDCAIKVEGDGIVGDLGGSNSAILPPREFKLTAGRRRGGRGNEGNSTEGE